MVIEREPLLTEKLPYPSGSVMKRVYKIPIVLYRLGWGPLIGRIFMILTTTGRKSGKPRRTTVEFRTVNGRKYAVVGWPQSDWYQNVLAHPEVTLQTVDGTESARVRKIETDAEYEALWEGVERDPIIQGMIKMAGVEFTRESFVAQKERFIILTFDPIDEPTPPPLQADLKWVPRVIVNMVVNAVVAMLIRRWIMNRRERRQIVHEAPAASNGVRPRVTLRR